MIRDIIDKLIPDVERFRDWSGIVLHHSATIDGRTFDWEGIRRYHTSWRFQGNIIDEARGLELRNTGHAGVERPWTDIGYHLGIELVGEELKVLKGRSLLYSGAHAKDFNSTHIGICIVGNYDQDHPSDQRWALALEVVRRLLVIYPATQRSVLGHWETYPLRHLDIEKSCPGTKWDMEKFRAEI